MCQKTFQFQHSVYIKKLKTINAKLKGYRKQRGKKMKIHWALSETGDTCPYCKNTLTLKIVDRNGTSYVEAEKCGVCKKWIKEYTD